MLLRADSYELLMSTSCSKYDHGACPRVGYLKCMGATAALVSAVLLIDAKARRRITCLPNVSFHLKSMLSCVMYHMLVFPCWYEAQQRAIHLLHAPLGHVNSSHTTFRDGQLLSSCAQMDAR
jgi:hypothetical protein